MDPITRRNEQARRQAQAAGQTTYRHDVVEAWPACTVCGRPIRAAATQGVGRRCGCDAVHWLPRHDGWHRAEKRR